MCNTILHILPFGRAVVWYPYHTPLRPAAIPGCRHLNAGVAKIHSISGNDTNSMASHPVAQAMTRALQR
jgi:hypothetical protein